MKNNPPSPRLERVSLRACAVFAAFALVAGAKAYDLDSLPVYQPQQKVSGTVRNYGSELAGVVPLWEKGFGKYQPDVKFADTFPSSDGWTAGLEAKVADIGTSGREVFLTEYLSFNETFGFDPTEIAIATGAADIKGKTWALILYVNKDNPISKLTMKQVDGIFGSERSGGYRGLKWYPQYGRGREDDIRTWDQLGLTGDWAGKEIQTYGYATTGMTNFFQIRALNGGDKWNPNYREYVEYDTKMVSEGPIGATGSSKYMLAHDLSNNKYGIAWSGIPHGAGIPGIKALAIADKDGSPYVMASRETVQNRTYPLSRLIFMYIARPPNTPVEPRIKEFLLYVLSRQGQEDVVTNGKYLPLTADLVAEMRKKLD